VGKAESAKESVYEVGLGAGKWAVEKRESGKGTASW